jgi:uncharacterized membrane protein
MVAYHLFYSMAWLFDIPAAVTIINAAEPYEPLIVGAFILLSGVSSQLSRSNLARGLRLIPCAAIVTLVTVIFLPDFSIKFGILHFLALATIIFHFLKPLLRRVPPLAGILVSAAIFVLLYDLPVGYIGLLSAKHFARLPAVLYSNNFLLWLGFTTPSFFSADYFPLLPWFFLFLIGAFAGIPLAEGRAPKLLRRKYVPLLGAMGRHSLIIYLLHQPVIVAVLWVVQSGV